MLCRIVDSMSHGLEGGGHLTVAIMQMQTLSRESGAQTDRVPASNLHLQRRQWKINAGSDGPSLGQAASPAQPGPHPAGVGAWLPAHLPTAFNGLGLTPSQSRLNVDFILSSWRYMRTQVMQDRI